MQSTMKSIVPGLLLLAISACSTPVPPQAPAKTPRPPVNTCTATPSDAPVENDSLEVVEMTPAPGTALSPDSLIAITLRYALKEYGDGDYFFMAQFSLEDPKRSNDGAFPRTAYPHACGPRGVVRYYFPMAYVWNFPLIKRPFDVKMLMNHDLGNGHSQSVARTAVYSYPAR